jgi:hypothetical protein
MDNGQQENDCLCDVAPGSLVDIALIALMMEAVTTCETSVKF